MQILQPFEPFKDGLHEPDHGTRQARGLAVAQVLLARDGVVATRRGPLGRGGSYGNHMDGWIRSAA